MRIHRSRTPWWAVAAVILASACDLPEDPHSTPERESEDGSLLVCEDDDCPAYTACQLEHCGSVYAECFGENWMTGEFDGVCADLLECQTDCACDDACEEACEAGKPCENCLLAAAACVFSNCSEHACV